MPQCPGHLLIFSPRLDVLFSGNLSTLVPCHCFKMASPNPPPQCDGQIAEDFEDDNERRLWEYAMKEYRLGGKSQRETAVLMISWAKDLDDLHTEGEVNGLEAVFADLFNYTVVKRQISGDKRPAIQLTKYLADFVHKYDNESTLLIIYYAGHGVPKVPGGLHFAGYGVSHFLVYTNSLIMHE